MQWSSGLGEGGGDSFSSLARLHVHMPKRKPHSEQLPKDLAKKILHEATKQKMDEQESDRKKDFFRDKDFDHDDDDDDDNHDQHQQQPNQFDSDEDNPEHIDAPAYYNHEQDFELSEQDERALNLFMGGGAQPRTLADMIMDKIAERDQAQPGPSEESMPALPQKVLEVYRSVGQLLRTYRSGKLPKAFKIVPRLANWEEVLYVTDPDSWSPAALREATKLFASNMNPKMAQRFFNLVLLPAVQDDIRENGRLNFHLYLALKKALYKPAAFFKGVLLPLGEGGTTLREALIVCSVLAKVSIPMLHSAVAIMKLSEMRYCGANALFLRTLLLKKYALPYRVVDELVQYFLTFKDAAEVPTLLWQQCLLAFAQHYKTEITSEQREALKHLLRAQPHPVVTPEIRRELFSANRSRGDPFIAHFAGLEGAVPDVVMGD